MAGQRFIDELAKRAGVSQADVDGLIAAARNHPLGVDFLLNGDLSAVAATFRAHAFTVDAARDQLRGHTQPWVCRNP